MARGIVLGIRLRFHDHAPKQAAVCLAFQQPTANQLRGNDLRWAGEEGAGKDREILGDELGNQGSDTSKGM